MLEEKDWVAVNAISPFIAASPDRAVNCGDNPDIQQITRYTQTLSISYYTMNLKAKCNVLKRLSQVKKFDG